MSEIQDTSEIQDILGMDPDDIQDTKRTNGRKRAPRGTNVMYKINSNSNLVPHKPGAVRNVVIPDITHICNEDCLNRFRKNDTIVIN